MPTRRVRRRRQREARPEREARIVLPAGRPNPVVSLLKRLLAAMGLVALVALVVWLDGDGYRDETGRAVGLLESVYYATVSITTTGYGDITPVTDRARLLTAIVVTPARVAFLVLLVGTTVELLTEQWRQAVRETRWRRTLGDHYVICGYGTKGRSAARALVGLGIPREDIVIVEYDQSVVSDAGAGGFVTVAGDMTRGGVLREAGIHDARAVVVAPNRDDTSVLATLTARELNPSATIVSAVREEENAHLLKQSGADSVITSAEASGRLLGLATRNPRVVEVLEDLLNVGEGLEIAVRDAMPAELGRPLSAISDQLAIALIRQGELLRFDDPRVERLQEGDRVLGLRSIR